MHESVKGIIGCSPQLTRLRAQIARVAGLDTPVFITGESGSGKSVVAEALHESSRRAGRRFDVIAVSAIPEVLVESEMFGYERGAYPWARGTQPGWLERAHGGTLVLKEIAQLPETLQPKLLRAVREGVVRRAGSDRPITVDVRVIVESLEPPQALLARGFSAALGRALSVNRLHIPPLRRRRRDIPVLARHFLAKFAAAYDRPFTHFSSDAMRILTSSAWPGNVRQLASVIESAVVSRDPTVLGPDDLARLRWRGQRRR